MMSRFTPTARTLIRATNRPHVPSHPPKSSLQPCHNTLQLCHNPLLTKEKVSSYIIPVTPLPKALQRWDQPLPDALAIAALESHEENSRLS